MQVGSVSWQLCLYSVSHLSITEMPVTAADIPEDLFQNIVLFIRSQHNPLAVNRQKATKHDLMSCSLACRYWARLLRPTIFHTIIIRSAQDLDTLLGFLNSPASDMGVHLKCLILEQSDAPVIPWAHNVYAKLPQLTSLERLEHKVVGQPLSRPDNPFRSIHDGLPRGLPSIFYRCTLFDLSNFHAKSFTDVISLIGEISCDDVNIRGVSWAICPTDPCAALRKPRRFLHRHLHVYGHDAEEQWRFFWLCVTVREPRDPETAQYIQYVSRREIAHVGQLLRFLTTNRHLRGISVPSTNPPEPTKPIMPGCAHKEFKSTFCTLPIMSCRSSLSLLATFGYRNFILQISCVEEKTCSPDLEVYIEAGAVVQIRVIWSEGSQEQSIIEYDWAQFDSLVAQFVDIRLVIITAHTTSTDQKKWQQAVESQMVHMKGVNKLMFRTMDRHVGDRKWF